MRAVYREWRARRIADPVARLRYLRRCWAPPGPRRQRLRLPAAAIAATAFALFVSPTAETGNESRRQEQLAPPVAMPASHGQAAEVWLVETGRDWETYSNGLRIETAGAAANGARRWQALALDATPELWRSEPAGIVFHTTESHIASFESANNLRLRRIGRWLLDYVRTHRSYHYLVDRFGRVHRTVVESSPAAHAGWSIWADRRQIYCGLNDSFLGVAFESETTPGDSLPGHLSPAQMRAGRMLTEMLRSRYRISAGNCVTHAQVSVNPAVMRIGNHTDWAANFPFAALGLPDNYELPLPAISVFGLRYDGVYLAATGSRLWKSLLLSEEILRQQALLEGTSLERHRIARQRLYRRLLPAKPQIANEKERSG